MLYKNLISSELGLGQSVLRAKRMYSRMIQGLAMVFFVVTLAACNSASDNSNGAGIDESSAQFALHRPESIASPRIRDEEYVLVLLINGENVPVVRDGNQWTASTRVSRGEELTAKVAWTVRGVEVAVLEESYGIVEAEVDLDIEESNYVYVSDENGETNLQKLLREDSEKTFAILRPEGILDPGIGDDDYSLGLLVNDENVPVVRNGNQWTATVPVPPDSALTTRVSWSVKGVDIAIQEQDFGIVNSEFVFDIDDSSYVYVDSNNDGVTNLQDILRQEEPPPTVVAGSPPDNCHFWFYTFNSEYLDWFEESCGRPFDGLVDRCETYEHVGWHCFPVSPPANVLTQQPSNTSIKFIGANYDYGDSNYRVFENEAEVIVFVERSGNTSSAIDIEVKTVSGSVGPFATEGVDYLKTRQVLKWGIGESGAKPVTVRIVRDDLAEEEEVFYLQLSNLTNIDDISVFSRAVVGLIYIENVGGQ